MPRSGSEMYRGPREMREMRGLAEDSEQYQKLYQQKARQRESLFGAVLPEHLAAWDRIIVDASASDEQRAHAQKDRDTFLSGQHPRMAWTIEQLTEAVVNSELRTFLTALTELEKTNIINVADPENLTTQFAQMNGQQVLDFLEWYGRAFEKRREAVLDIAERKRELFLQRAEVAIRDGWLKGRVNIHVMKKRVEEIVFDVSDPLMNSAYGSADVWRIVINAAMDENGIDDVVTHELAHAALSVRELNVVGIRGFDRLQFPRSGLRTTEYDANGQDGNVQYQAINEAITEIAALKLRGKDQFGRGGYAIERGSLHVLLERKPEQEDILWDAWAMGENGSNREAWEAFQRAENWSSVIQSSLHW